jgi:thiol-disulfide isomerase/thioredoxin
MSDRDRVMSARRLILAGAAALVLCAVAPFLCAEGPAKLAASVTTVDRAGYDGIVDKLRGKVVLVDFWATWCLPCMAQLPHTVGLDRRLRERGLAVVTVSMDEAENIDQVQKTLAAKRAAPLTNLMSSAGGSPQSMEAFEISGGALPHYKLYGRTGVLRQEFGLDPTAEKQFTPEDVEAAVEKLLAE